MPRLEKRWRSLIEGGGTPVHGLLRLASLGYGGAIALRNAFYDGGFPVCRSPLPTVSVGNLLVGGSGKTPLVRFLARALEGRVAILSRGYGSLAEKRKGPTQVFPDSDWREVGDEPLMLAQSLPGTLVVASPDRVEGARFAKSLGADTLLLDDGFQHRRLLRDQDIVCIPANLDLSKLALFPRGPLREPLSALKRASLIAITECQEGVEPVCLPYLPPDVPQRRFCSRPLLVMREEEVLEKRVALFCGIARPERFVETAKSLGLQVTETLFLPDHGVPTEKQLAYLRQTSDLLICTEKDWVKGAPADGYITLELTTY